MEYEIVDEGLPLVELYNAIRDEWIIRWYAKDDGKMVQTIISPRPTLERIKEVVLGWHNKEIDKAILFGHRWRDMPIWLSSENQQNYKASFDLAVQFQGQGGTLPLTYKFGTELEPQYHTFETLEELTDFYVSTVQYVKEVLVEGWQKKDAIDWGKYTEELKKYEH